MYKYLNNKKDEYDYEKEYKKLIKDMESKHNPKDFNFDEPIVVDEGDRMILYDIADYILRRYVTIHVDSDKGRERDEQLWIDKFSALLYIGRAKIEFGSTGGSTLNTSGIYFYFQDDRLPDWFYHHQIKYVKKDGKLTGNPTDISKEDMVEGYYESYIDQTRVENKGISLGLDFGHREVEVPEKLVATHIDHHSFNMLTGAPVNSTVGQYTKVENHKKKVVDTGNFVSNFTKAINTIHQTAESKISYNNNRYKKSMEYFKENGMPKYHQNRYTK